jgi:hypothetical protein
MFWPVTVEAAMSRTWRSRRSLTIHSNRCGENCTNTLVESTNGLTHGKGSGWWHGSWLKCHRTTPFNLTVPTSDGETSCRVTEAVPSRL